MDPFMLRTQLERNNADLEQYSRDLTEWSKEMKKKEGGCIEKKPKEAKKKVNMKNEQEQESKMSQKAQRFGGVDYTAWDKYDADEECEKLDNQKNISAANYDDISDETDEEMMEESITQKETGNNFFKAKDFEKAIKCYNRAIGLYAYSPIYFANRAMCYLKLKNYEKAESDCSQALHIDKKYVKAYQRRAIARENLDKLAEAKEDILKVFDFEPSNKESKEVLKRIENKMKDITKPIKSTNEKHKINQTTPTETQEKGEHNFIRPKSKFALSRQQNKDIKTTFPNLTEPISDKIIERRLDSPSTSKEHEIAVRHLHEFKPCPAEPINAVQDMFFKWPKYEEGIKEYGAIKKLPNTRSESVLKKINVAEAENKRSADGTPSKQFEKTKKSKKSYKQVTDTSITTKFPMNSNELDGIIFANVPKDDFSKLTSRPVPKTSLQFYYNWKELDSELKYLFLLQINPREFLNIFKDSLESHIFSDMLKIMSTEFIPREKSVMPHLYGLSKVKRFSTLIMFKTAEDTAALKILMEYVQRDRNFSEFVDLLIKRYEMI